MKVLSVLIFTALAVPAFGQIGNKARKAIRHGATKANIGKHAAMREEQIIDRVDNNKIDAQKWKDDPEASDVRPTGINAYHNRTQKRIVALLRHGALSEESGKFFKDVHDEITAKGKELNSDGELCEEDCATLRTQLDDLNDDINAAAEAPEEGDERTPLLNQTQHRFEERIEFGVRSGRLSTGEAATLTRKLESLQRMEDREKSGGLSTREREDLFEEAAELNREINKALKD